MHFELSFFNGRRPNVNDQWIVGCLGCKFCNRLTDEMLWRKDGVRVNAGVGVSVRNLQPSELDA